MKPKNRQEVLAEPTEIILNKGSKPAFSQPQTLAKFFYLK